MHDAGLIVGWAYAMRRAHIAEAGMLEEEVDGGGGPPLSVAMW